MVIQDYKNDTLAFNDTIQQKSVDLVDEIIKLSGQLNLGRIELKDRNSNFYALWGKTPIHEGLFKNILFDICLFGESIVTRLPLDSYHLIRPYLMLLQKHLESVAIDYDEFSEILSLKKPKAASFLPAKIAVLFDCSTECLKVARETKMTLKHFLDREIPIYHKLPENIEEFDILIKILGKDSNLDEKLQEPEKAIVVTVPSAYTYSMQNLDQYLSCRKASFNIDNGYGAAIFALKILNMNTKSTGSVLLASAGIADNYIMQRALDLLADNGSIQNIFCLRDIGINNIDGTISSLKELESVMKVNFSGLAEGDFGFDTTLAFAGFEGALSVLLASKINGSVISVPTGVGYGTNDLGRVTYLTMINGCGAGTVTVSPADIETACALTEKIINLRKQSSNRIEQKVSSPKITFLN